VAVHPNFGTNHWMYLCFTTPSDVRVQRYVVDTTDWVGIDAAGQPALTGIPFGEIHHGCRIRFQPGTTTLFVTTGDATIGPGPQSGASLAGKVLRVNENLGPVPGNPGIGVDFYDDRIYTGGHRNVQGLAFGPGNVPYTSEHGEGNNDEVNRLVAGGNGGWDPNNNGVYDPAVPMTDLAKFPDAMRPVWRSGDFGTLAPSGAEFLSGAQWGSWDGALAVAFLKGRQLMIMFLNGDGTINSTWSELEIGGLKANGRYPRLRGATLGPDGNLYIATDAPAAAVGDNFPGEIWKITPTAGT
jgi:glucose/arabinose dehydrogenase